MTTEKQSTPITAEGLRGLGFVRDGHWEKIIGRDMTVINVSCTNTVYINSDRIGTASDLETVGRLIDVLRRMNGGGA